MFTVYDLVSLKLEIIEFDKIGVASKTVDLVCVIKIILELQLLASFLDGCHFGIRQRRFYRVITLVEFKFRVDHGLIDGIKIQGEP